jgi:hypothetical protein
MDIPVFATEAERDEYYTIMGAAWELMKFRNYTDENENMIIEENDVEGQLSEHITLRCKQLSTCPKNPTRMKLCNRLCYKDSSKCWLHCDRSKYCPKDILTEKQHTMNTRTQNNLEPALGKCNTIIYTKDGKTFCNRVLFQNSPTCWTHYRYRALYTVSKQLAENGYIRS